MMRLLSLCMLVGAVVSFAPSQPWGASRPGVVQKVPITTTSRFMFNVDDNDSKKSTTTTVSAPELKTVDTSSPTTTMETVATEQAPVVRNVVRDMNTGEIKEVKWVDPAMRANTRPWEMSWWAYLAFGFPMVLLANDFLHFLPKDGLFGLKFMIF